MTRISQITPIRIVGQGAQSGPVGRSLADRVQDLHVPDVVDEEGLLETDDQPRSVHLDREDSAGVAVIADLGAFLEVANPELPRGRFGHDGHQRRGEKSFGDEDLLDAALENAVQTVAGVERVKLVPGVCAHSQRPIYFIE